LAVDNPDTRPSAPASDSVLGPARLIPAHEFSLYSLDGPDATAATSSSPPFSPTLYSRYKYGSVAAAEAFACDLGEAFRECRPELIRAPRLLMTSSPYTYVPTAATALARSLQPVLNAARAEAGLPPAPFVQVDRIGTSAGDYGTLQLPQAQHAPRVPPPGRRCPRRRRPFGVPRRRLRRRGRPCRDPLGEDARRQPGALARLRRPTPTCAARIWPVPGAHC
jgi:hypothetical protein